MSRHQQPFFFKRGQPPVGMKVRTIRCEGDMDTALTALFSGEEFVPRFFSEQTYHMYMNEVIQKVFSEEEERERERLTALLHQKMSR